jgi:hypothetical protein
MQFYLENVSVYIESAIVPWNVSQFMRKGDFSLENRNLNRERDFPWKISQFMPKMRFFLGKYHNLRQKSDFSSENISICPKL